MSNLIQIKRGSGKPEQHVLKPHELGFDTLNKKLYIGDINENPINVGRPIETVPAESFDVANADENTIYILESDDAVVTTSVLESASAEFRVGLEDVSQRVSDIEEAIENGIGGGGSGGVTSWNDLKDKPFYSELVEKEIYDVNAELAAVEGSLFSMQVSATEYLHFVKAIDGAPTYHLNTVNLIEGNKYVIVIDGNRYEYTAKGMQLDESFNNAYCIALGEAEAFITQDLANFTVGFALMTWPNGFTNLVIGCKNTSATAPASFKVYELVGEVKQLDPKYYERLAWVEEGLSDKWEFNGNIEDYETYLLPSDMNAPEGSCFIRVSPNYIESEKLVGAYGAVYSSGNIFENTFSEDMIKDISSEVGFQAYSINDMMTSLSQDYPEVGLPAGTFFMYIPNYMWVVSVTTLEPIFDTEVVHTIDPKFFEKGTVGWTEPGETSAVWNFDGNLDNVEYYDVGSGTYYVRVLDRYIEPELLIGGSCTGTLEGMEDTVTITSSMIGDISGQTGFPAYQVNGQFGLVVSESFNGLPAGVYIMYIPDYVIVNRLVFTEDVFVLKEETVHKIDPKFLPDSIGGGGIPDWNQNDPNGIGYIKNRTHWEEEVDNVVVIVDNFTKSEYEDDNNDNKPKLTFVVGEKYNVIWNGVLYNDLVCILDVDWRILGGNDFPFYIDDDGGDNFYVNANDNSDWIVSITQGQGKKTVVHKIDPKFLPDGMGGSISWNDLEDKPFGDDCAIKEKDEEIFSVSQNFIANEHGEIFYSDDVTFEFSDGETYFVDYDGTTYECMAYLANAGSNDEPNYLPVIGNVEIVGLSGGNAEPFFIGTNIGEIFVYVQTEGTHDIVLFNSVDSVGIKKLDKKYLPDDIGGASSWNNLTDKPFEVPTIYYEWNCNDSYSTTASGQFIKISDDAPTSDFFVGKQLYAIGSIPGYGLVEQDPEITSNMIRDLSTDSTYSVYSIANSIVVVLPDTLEVGEISLTKGVWLSKEAVASYMFSIKITDAPAKKISDMVIPDTIARAAQINDLITYGTDDLVAGESKLDTGKLYFVYE